MNFHLHPYIQKIANETMTDDSVADERNFVEGFFDNWVGNFLHPYGDQLLDSGKLYNSLFYCYLSGQSTNFHWYGHSLFYGAYTVVFREFRCILEGLFIVYKIEFNHYEKTMQEKLEILSTAETTKNNFGKRVFHSSGFPGWEAYYKIYRELSSYIHFSYTRTAHIIQKIQTDNFPETVDYKYSKSQFLDACRIWKAIAKLAIEMGTKLGVLDNIKLAISDQLFDV